MLNDDKGLKEKVKSANRDFYDIVADVYEEVNERENDELRSWLSGTLEELSLMTSGEVLLDFGCGTGVLMNSGKKYFKQIYGIDISMEMLKITKDKGGSVICGEESLVPIRDNSIDVVTCFSVLHHIFDHGPLFSEIYRVLKNGGVLYTDHDTDKTFINRFKIPLKFYRSIFNSCKRYMKAKKEVTEDIFRLAEIHFAEGVDSDTILNQLKEEGFTDISCYFHWFGVRKVFDWLMRHWKFSRGFAPIVSIKARK